MFALLAWLRTGRVEKKVDQVVDALRPGPPSITLGRLIKMMVLLWLYLAILIGLLKDIVFG